MEFFKIEVLDNTKQLWFPQSAPPSDTVKNITGWGITVANDIPKRILGVIFNSGQLDTIYDGNSFGLRLDYIKGRFRKIKMELNLHYGFQILAEKRP